MLHLIVWFAILIFRGFPVFIKFFIEYELLITLINNFYIIGAIYFFVISFFGVIGFSRVWLSILYGQPTVKSSRLLFKRDLIIAFSFIILLILLQLFLMVKNLLIVFHSINSYIISFRLYKHHNISIIFYLFFIYLIISTTFLLIN